MVRTCSNYSHRVEMKKDAPRTVPIAIFMLALVLVAVFAACLRLSSRHHSTYFTTAAGNNFTRLRQFSGLLFNVTCRTPQLRLILYIIMLYCISIVWIKEPSRFMAAESGCPARIKTSIRTAHAVLHCRGQHAGSHELNRSVTQPRHSDNSNADWNTEFATPPRGLISPNFPTTPPHLYILIPPVAAPAFFEWGGQRGPRHF